VKSRLLVFGSRGQVGRSILKKAASASIEAIGLSHEEADICDARAVAQRIRIHAPTSVVNAAGYTAVDKAENEPDHAFRVNQDGARVVAAAAASAGIPVIQLSTDYVFDGRTHIPYTEDAQTNPLGVYGRSKEAGEHEVQDANPMHLILRTSGVYSPFGTNFIRTMLRLGAEGKELRIVKDQTLCPTSAADIATVVLSILKTLERERFGVCGLYHYAGADPVTWYDLAELIFEEGRKYGVTRPILTPISSADFGASARRPAYSVLNTGKFTQAFGFEALPLRFSLAKCLKIILMS
jgi:dTDP-4-dehydrorhamnose reductase